MECFVSKFLVVDWIWRLERERKREREREREVGGGACDGMGG